ncbi:hypothetical protein BDZ89DRAFT_1057633 [Hymenopellis radicata]|nr:hypothetical protein BDZ89DRAFT_1057614 [Hymenopellis radicata]KAF9049266.1 hypothetical protein BDZ89DRAFT_1057622 [Hymenopellis radicata]KAF9049273.1 hypothetical protein BDZ89DRAFT_1057633 [Hymenopellis radicata]
MAASSHKRMDLQNRFPPASDIISPSLEVSIPDHRFAMTRILLGAHNLHGVHSESPQASIALQQCRMCHDHLETAEHMLLQCVADNETIDIRREFFQRLTLVMRKVHSRNFN